MKRRTKTVAVAKKSVSFPGDMLERAEKRAAAKRRNFSNYIQSLVADDLEKQEKAVAA